jgi:hypothetical protein
LLNNPTISVARDAKLKLESHGIDPALIKAWLQELRFRLMSGYVPPKKYDGNAEYFEDKVIREVGGKTFCTIWWLDRERDGHPFTPVEFHIFPLPPPLHDQP